MELKHKPSKFIISISISLIILLSSYSFFLQINSKTKISKVNNLNSYQMNNLIEGSYIPINPDGKKPVGTIYMISIDGLAPGLTLINPNIIIDKNMTFTYSGYKFLGTIAPASSKTRDWENFKGNLTIRVNETAKFQYWYNETTKLVSFKSELSPKGILREVYVNNTQIDLSNITHSQGGYFYNYSHYYNQKVNDTLVMSFIIDYNVSISYWFLHQVNIKTNRTDNPYLINKTTNIEGYYNYSIAFGDENVKLNATFLINPPDQNYIYNISMNIYQGNIENPLVSPFTSYIKHSNNSIQLSIQANGTTMYSLNFKANFKLQFLNTNGPNFWQMDLLTGGIDLRQRIYEIKCIEGPPSIPISNFYYNETQIPFPDLISVSSELGRPINSEDMNFTNEYNIKIGPAGVKLNFMCKFEGESYYLVLNETDKITITYKASHSLNLIVLDNVKIPVGGAELKIFYQDVPFGTLMSAVKTNQIPLKYTDNSGQVILSNVPNGKYSIEVYYKGKYISTYNVTTTNSLNYIFTSIPHFPIWIIIFSCISLVICLNGIYIYRKYRI